MNKEIIQSPQAPAPIGPYSQAILAGNTLYCSGQIALDAQTGELYTGDISAETRKVMENIGAVLQAAGFGYGDIVKTSIFLQNMDDFAAVNAVYGTYFSGNFPARETVQVAALPKNANVEISIIAVR